MQKVIGQILGCLAMGAIIIALEVEAYHVYVGGWPW